MLRNYRPTQHYRCTLNLYPIAPVKTSSADRWTGYSLERCRLIEKGMNSEKLSICIILLIRQLSIWSRSKNQNNRRVQDLCHTSIAYVKGLNRDLCVGLPVVYKQLVTGLEGFRGANQVLSFTVSHNTSIILSLLGTAAQYARHVICSAQIFLSFMYQKEMR